MTIMVAKQNEKSSLITYQRRALNDVAGVTVATVLLVGGDMKKVHYW